MSIYDVVAEKRGPHWRVWVAGVSGWAEATWFWEIDPAARRHIAQVRHLPADQIRIGRLTTRETCILKA
ncbi:MAG: hypothetical protein LBR19_05130 [Bifidobacteriaceae bacterium]|jgi:hypothetical protein|nr:hypothetical protein [Bifidobacteriaceae bacterium]